MFAFFERLLDPFPEDADPAAPPKTFFRFVAYYVGSSWPWLAAIMALNALIAIGDVALYAGVAKLIDWMGRFGPEGLFEERGGALLGFAVFALVILPGIVWIKSFVAYQTVIGNLAMRNRWRMHRHMLRQSMGFFGDEFAGRVATKVMQTSLAVREAVMQTLDAVVYVSVFFLSMTGFVFANDWRLGLPLLLWFAVYAMMLVHFVPRLGEVSARQADARSTMTGRIVDSYTNIMSVKLFAHARREETYAKEGMAEFLGTVHPQMRLVTQLNGFVFMNTAVLIVLIAALGVHLWRGDLVTIGVVGTAVALALRLDGMSHWVMWEVSGIFENVGVITDGARMLSREPDVTDAADAEPLRIEAGAIAFDRIGFHYGKEGGVIDDLTLDVAGGEKVGLVGRSGAGKSTLMNLLLRLYDLEKGAIRIDGRDVASVTQESLRAQIGVVTQDTALLHRSIRDNIAYGRPDAGEEAVRRAAERADALDFIEDLKDAQGRRGFDAHVGERGVKLSGGQRQRIAIARIFLKDAPILVLDEATSALDSEVEAAIQSHLFALMEGKTVIAIAHRLSTIAAMDRLVILDRGAIVEEGSHHALLRRGGLYADLWARQSGGFVAGAQPAAAE